MNPNELTFDTSKLDEVIAEYLEAVESGQNPDRDDLIKRHPDVADGLRAFFADEKHFDQIASPLKDAIVAANTLDDSAAPNATDPRTIRYFGDYELLEEIARGGMGVVYKARQVSLNRTVALKLILSGQLAGSDDVKRFRAEAEAAASLDHPNIVPIYEIGEHDGNQYFSMKLIEGTSLAKQIPMLVKDPRGAAGLLATVARGIHYAHQRGILHRDLKPANILIDRQDRPHITDFGLAKRVEHDSGLTQSGAILGTPAYMSPEQASGQAKRLSVASDVYSLGAIFYEMLTGSPPFKSDTVMGVLMKVQTEEPAAPRQINAKMDRDLETICLKCLEKDSKRRYESAGAMADELERWLRGEPIQARPTTRFERLQKWVKRKPLAAALVAVSATALIVLFWSGWAFNERLQSVNEKLQERLRVSILEQVRAARLANNRSRSLELLADAIPLYPDRGRHDAGLRDEAIQTVAQAGLHRVFSVPFLVDPGSNSRIKRFNPHGTLLAVGGEGQIKDDPDYGGVRVYEIPSGRLLGRKAWDGKAGCFAWSPDGERLAVSKQGAAKPNAATGALESQPGTMIIWNPRSGAETAHFPAQGGPVFSPDGKRIAIYAHGMVAIYDIATEQPIATHDFSATISINGISVLRYLPSEELLIQTDRRQFLWNAVTGKETPLGEKGEQVLVTSADRGVVAVKTSDGVSLRDTLTRAERTRLKLSSLSASYYFYLSPDGGRLIFEEPTEKSRMRVWDAATGKFLPGMREQGLQLMSNFWGQNTLNGGVWSNQNAPWPTSNPHISGDGAWFAAEAGTGAKRVMIWDISTGAKVATLADSSQPEWSSDGRWLAVGGQGSVQEGNATWSGQVMVEVWETFRATTEQRMLVPVQSIQWRADSKRLSANDTLWDVEDRAGRAMLRNIPLESLEKKFGWDFGEDGHYYAKSGWITESDGRTYFAEGGPGTTTRLVDRSPEQAWIIAFLPGDQMWACHMGQVDRLYFEQIAPEKKSFAAFDPSKTKSSWYYRMGSAAFSPDGKSVLLANNALLNDFNDKSTPGTVAGTFQFELWNLADGKQTAVWPAVKPTKNDSTSRSTGNLDAITVFSPDGKRVASACFVNNGFEIRDSASGEQLQVMRPNRSDSSIRAIAFTPDSRLVVCCLEKRTHIYDVASGRELAVCANGPATLNALSVSPDGQTFATGDAEKTIRLWEIPSGRELAHWEAHDTAVTALAFSSDGKTLASGSQDGVLRLWNLPAIRRGLVELGLDW